MGSGCRIGSGSVSILSEESAADERKDLVRIVTFLPRGMGSFRRARAGATQDGKNEKTTLCGVVLAS